METFSTSLALCVEILPVPLTKASDAELWCEDGALRRHRTHYDITVMCMDFRAADQTPTASLRARILCHSLFQNLFVENVHFNAHFTILQMVVEITHGKQK